MRWFHINKRLETTVQSAEVYVLLYPVQLKEDIHVSHSVNYSVDLAGVLVIFCFGALTRPSQI